MDGSPEGKKNRIPNTRDYEFFPLTSALVLPLLLLLLLFFLLCIIITPEFPFLVITRGFYVSISPCVRV